MTNKILFSRRDARPRFAVQRVNDFAEHHRVTPQTGGGTGFGSIMPSALFEHDLSENRYPLFRIMLDK